MHSVLWLYAFIGVLISSSPAASSECENPPLDIAIVIDQTKSVGKRNYDTMLDSVKSLIDKYDVGDEKTHFSIVTYSGDAKVRVSLDDKEYHSKEALKKLLDEMKENDKLGSPTRTDKALKAVGEVVFREVNGDRPESPNIMIVFTDGNTHKNSEPYDTVIPTLQKKGVHRVAVGIGKDIKESELETIAGDESRVVNAEDFEDLDNQLDDIRESTCNIDGGYTEWTEWTECTATCGGGTQKRSRTCTNPSPKNDGKTCITQEQLGLPEETQVCNTQDCPEPGGYTNWSSWGECSVTCGEGVQKRTRTCTKPPPSGGGPDCVEQDLGPAQEEEACNEGDCPVPGGYTDWSSWGECSVTCGGGVQKRTRTCTKPPPSGGGPNCVEQDLGPAQEEEACNEGDCPVPGGYTEWSSWGECSVTCGGGVQKRTRTCTKPPPSGGGPDCIEQDLGPAQEEEACNEGDCPVPGGYTEWSSWGECSVTCGGGVQKRTRTCTKPPPSGGGPDCIEQDLGPAEEGQACNKGNCQPPPPKPCKEHLDVGVIIDSSNSIKQEDYKSCRDYIKRLAERLQISEEGTHIAILLYSFEAHTWHRFSDTQSIDAIKSKADSLPHIRGGTRTDRALELAAEDFFGWEDSGDRPDKPNVLIVLTDGDTNEGSKPFSQVIPPLDEAGVRRIAVGIGSDIDLGELQQIASNNKDVLQVQNYGQLDSKLEEIMMMACEEQYPGDCGDWGSYGECSKTCGGGVQLRSRTCPANSLHLRQQKVHCNTNLCAGQKPCIDKEENCPRRAASGDCWKTAVPPTMFYVGKTFPLWDKCQKSCRRCNVDISCQDSDPYICPYWSKAQANRYKCNSRFLQGFRIYYLKEMCKKSCNQCNGGGGGGQGGYGGGSRPGYGGGSRPGYGGGSRPGYGGGSSPGYGGGSRPGYGGSSRPGYGGPHRRPAWGRR